MPKFRKRNTSLHPIIQALLLLFLSFFFSNYSDAANPSPETQACSEVLFGTMSEKDCEKLCKKGSTEYGCKEVPGITSMDCYACVRDQYCSDLGLLSAWDCPPCDANPKTECVKAGTALPLGGGTFGGKTWSGEQCYKCQPKPDRCNQKWPGTSWLAACQATCPAPKKCVQVGIHEGNACFACQAPPQSCKDMGLLTQAQCAPCDADPKTTCIFWGLDANLQACFKCIPRPQPPPPPPPPPKTCKDAGYLDNCNPCFQQGKGCNFVGVDKNLICAECYERTTPPQCQPPDLNAWDCPDCVKRGGTCIPKTRTRDDPDCYYCYIPPKPREGCAKYYMFDGCSPDPCHGDEVCKTVQPEPDLVCAVCEAPEEPPDPTCEELQMFPDCATCYRAQMACRQVFVPDKGIWCARCYTPDDERQCGDGELPGTCDQVSCPSGQHCWDVADDCHRCEGSGTCRDEGYLNCDTDCAACEQNAHLMCTTAWFSKEDGQCCKCVTRPVGMECEDGTLPGDCPGSCTSEQKCVGVGYSCHVCLEKEDTCEKNGALKSCRPNPCNPETEVCDNFSPKPGLYCYKCKTKAEWCSEYGDYFPSCTPNPCPQGERCEETYVTMSNIKCATCISKIEDEQMCEKYEMMDGACSSSACEIGLVCEDADILGVKCHECQCEHGAYPGKCSEDYCREDEKCVQLLGGKCYRCESKTGTCRDDRYLNCQTECAECEKDPSKICKQAGFSKEDGACCSCEDRMVHQICLEGQIPGSCPGSCSSDQKCIQADNNCYTCQPKECGDYGLLASCTICDVEGDHCVEKKPRPDLICYECETNPCKPNLTQAQCAECENRGGICQSLTTGTRERGTQECFKCVPKPPECPQGTTQGVCTQTSCSSNQECVPAGENCYRCQTKKQTCEDMGMTDGEGCMNSGCIQQGGKCVQKTQDEYGVWCWECQKPTTTPQCDQGYQVGTCPGSCSSQQECVQAGECYTCRTKKKTCVDMGLNYGDECIQMCEPLGGKCTQKTQDDFGQWCWECSKKPVTTPQCDQGYQSGTCPGSCTSQQECVQAGECYTCQAKKKTCADLGKMTHDECGVQCPNPGENCKPQEYDELGYRCYICQPTTTLQCDDGYSTGGCPGNCSQTQECFGRSGPCHICREKEKAKTCAPNLGYQECAQECAERGTCLPVDAQGNPLPMPGGGGLDGISGATSLGGGSMTRTRPTPSTTTRPGDLCYKCFPAPECGVQGEYCYCKDCPPDTICLPGTVIYHPVSGEPFRCKKCVPKSAIEYIEYIIIIIDTPWGRYVLDKKGENPNRFEPSSIMALAKYDPTTGKIENAQGNPQALLGLFGGMNINGLVSTTQISIENLASKMKDGLGDKKNRYSDDCFEDVAKQDTGGGKAKGKKDKAKAEEEAPSETQPMTQPEGDLTVSGPVVACGKVKGEKTLNVYDASGSLVESISGEELKNNPNVVLDTMKKAQELTDRYLNIRRPSLMSILDKVSGLPLSQIKHAWDQVPEKKKPDIEDMEPNDTYYYVGEKKKKKLFGILGSSKPAPKIIIGSAIRMGGKALGGGADSERTEFQAEDQWGIRVIGYLPKDHPHSAWNVADGENKNVVVAVIDSGFDMDHPDRPQYLWTNDKETPNNGIDDDGNGFIDDVHGWNFLDENNDLSDLRGHGTCVASIIAAQRNNGEGIAGINPGAVIMPLKVTNKDGETNNLLIYRAIQYALNHGAQVMNISLGGRGISELEQTALNDARARGVFVAIASGNTGEYMGDVGPASGRYAFAVGAVDYDMQRSTISSFGPNNSIMAPGEQIYCAFSKDTADSGIVQSVRKAGYFAQSGTSFSTPMVTATASLLLSKYPTLRPQQIEDILMRTATDMNDPGWDDRTGAGLLNATAALSGVSADDLLTVKITEFRINKDEKKKIESVDVFATVRGELSQFTIGIGKGKLASRFKEIAGPYNKEADHTWVARLTEDDLRGGKEWMVEIEAKDKNGQVKTAQAFLDLTKQ